MNQMNAMTNDETNDLSNDETQIDQGAEQVEATEDGEEGETENSGKSIVARHYQLAYTKSAYSSSRHSGSQLAQILDGYSPEAVVAAIGQQIPEVIGKWPTLNPGQKRMNAGNAARHALKKGEFNLDVLVDALVDYPRGKPAAAPKAAKVAAPVSDERPTPELGEDGKETKASKAAFKKWNNARKAAVRAEVDAKAAGKASE